MEKKFNTFQDYLESSLEGMKKYEPRDDNSFYYKRGAIDTLEEMLRQVKSGEAIFPYI
ncbi:hypothetical protein [Robertmurraya siralis]|uniref:hypothetical protein n=1 Tax=Robertmurraya siralis TaxID=77777 RepID=UPI00147681D0|nr:hypothetical protein [Robertmurraya siralis]